MRRQSSSIQIHRTSFPAIEKAWRSHQIKHYQWCKNTFRATQYLSKSIESRIHRSEPKICPLFEQKTQNKSSTFSSNFKHHLAARLIIFRTERWKSTSNSLKFSKLFAKCYSLLFPVLKSRQILIKTDEKC